jgi:hypothetical protein
MIKLRRKQIPMTGVNREIPSKPVYFSGPYQAAAQGVDPPQSGQREPPQAVSRLARTIERLGRFLAEQKI